MTFQSIFKQVLTEGDKLILTWLSPLQDQGGYAIAVNYGPSFISELSYVVLIFCISAGQVPS